MAQNIKQRCLIYQPLLCFYFLCKTVFINSQFVSDFYLFIPLLHNGCVGIEYSQIANYIMENPLRWEGNNAV